MKRTVPFVLAKTAMVTRLILCITFDIAVV